MMLIHDKPSAIQALARHLDPRLRALLTERLDALVTRFGDLTDYTEFLVVEPGDDEAAIIRTVGFSPLIDPIDGHRWPDPRFSPGWDFLADHDGWFELIFTFGSTFAYILIVPDEKPVMPDLTALCRSYLADEL